jgi:hypothetical protein
MIESIIEKEKKREKEGDVKQLNNKHLKWRRTT